MKGKLDPFHAQIISQYLKSKEDFLNIIQVKKDFQFLLDRFRINPIPITEETKQLFKCLDTQQIFEKESYGDEIEIEEVQIVQINYSVSYSEYLEMKEEYKKKQKELKFKKS